MARKRLNTELFVFMNGERDGILINSSYGQLELRYHISWLNSSFTRALSLSMPFRAIDGHAKKLQHFLPPQGGFRLTPVYDVISAYPLLAKGNLHQKEIRMAMSLRSKKRQYSWERIYLRHWLATARQCNFPEQTMIDIIEQATTKVDTVIDTVASELPDGFPAEVARSIFDGMRQAKRRIKL